MTKQILVATDLSEASMSALRAAAELALGLGADVTLIHVLAPGRARKSVLPGASKPSPERVMHADDAEGAALKHVRETALGAVENVRLQLVSGESTAEAIVAQAARMHASYIVLGTKSKGGVAHAIQGSISEYVIHHAPCPVLVVPASLAPPPEPDADDEGL